MAEVNELKEKLPALEAESKAAEKELNEILATIPNLPLAEVPDGKDETGNVEHHAHGAKRNYAFTAQAAFRAGRSARHDGFRDRGEIVRRAVRGAEGRAGAHGARARADHARRAYGRAWV